MKAGIYTRISRNDQGEPVGVKRQESDARKLARTRGWEVVRVYSEDDRSATRGERPLWKELLSDLQAGRIGAVVAYSMSRLYRLEADRYDLMRIMRDTGAQVATVTSGDVNISTADNRMLLSILGAIDQAEAERIGERVKRAKVGSRADGKHNGGGRRPYGYERVKGNGFIVNESEASIIRRIVGEALAGRSLYSISAGLNGEDIPTAGEGRWAPNRTKRLLLSPFHNGRFKDGKRGSWPVLISDDEQATLHARLNVRDGHKGEGRSYVLSGIAECGECGTRVEGSAGYYRCSARSGGCGKVSIKVERLDVYTLSQVADWASEKRPRNLKRDERKALLADLAETQGRLDNLAEDYAQGILDGRQLKIASDRLRAHLSDLEEQLRTINPGEVPLWSLDEDDFERATDWPSAGKLKAREVVRAHATIRIAPGRGGRIEDRATIVRKT